MYPFQNTLVQNRSLDAAARGIPSPPVGEGFWGQADYQRHENALPSAFD